MATFVITVAIAIDADNEKQAEHGLEGALGNMVGDDIGSFELLETREQQEE